MALFKNEFLKILLPALVLYATVIVYQGYYYGKGDQSQILPVLYAQDHPGSYAQDHYVQSYLDAGINERTFFHFILRKLGYDSPFLVMFWHALSSIALFAAWISIAAMFIKSRYLQWIAIAVLFILGYHTAAGSNELYYPEFVPSLPAKALASWALYFFIKDKFTWWAVLLIPATFLQPLAGFQLFLITTLGLLLEKGSSRAWKQVPWKSIFLFLLFALPWIIMLAIHNGGQTNPSLFFEIIKFRLSHHFFASHFGIFHLLIALSLSAIVLVFYKGRLRWMALFVWIGLIMYEAGVEFLEIPFFLNAQWWKTTIWLEALGFIAITAFLEKKLFEKNFWYTLIPYLPGTLILLVLVYRFSGISSSPEYMTPLPGKIGDDVDISLKAGATTPPNAVFLISSDLSAFRWYSKRSTYVDYKAMLHQEIFLFEWYERIIDVYHPDRDRGSLTQNLKSTIEPSGIEISKWKSYGITHIITRSQRPVDLQLLISNNTYAVYRLP